MLPKIDSTSTRAANHRSQKPDSVQREPSLGLCPIFPKRKTSNLMNSKVVCTCKRNSKLKPIMDNSNRRMSSIKVDTNLEKTITVKKYVWNMDDNGGLPLVNNERSLKRHWHFTNKLCSCQPAGYQEHYAQGQQQISDTEMQRQTLLVKKYLLIYSNAKRSEDKFPYQALKISALRNTKPHHQSSTEKSDVLNDHPGLSCHSSLHTPGHQLPNSDKEAEMNLCDVTLQQNTCASAVKLPESSHPSEDLQLSETEADLSLQTLNEPVLCPQMSKELSYKEQLHLEMKFRHLWGKNFGKIPFHNLQSSFSTKLNPSQLLFIKKVYEMTCYSSTFGLEECMVLHSLSTFIGKLSAKLQFTYDNLNPETCENGMVKYMNLFCSIDRQKKGFISIASLQQILEAGLELDLSNHHRSSWEQMLTDLQLEETEPVSRLQYLAYIPFFLSLENGSLDCIPSDSSLT
ncbi:uncharacterized protein LOC120534338 isoform X2 [Polypterus senegalus]|uniref:uncharacterized protein LOC120534338 isoform X2 n=1 Tax=Polypterus senegalus TaxID=55291 RepID=UPI001965B625|nr:uncharacterized protein LOC120534338 isoform X2 [Polypterus senegalus]